MVLGPVGLGRWAKAFGLASISSAVAVASATARMDGTPQLYDLAPSAVPEPRIASPGAAAARAIRADSLDHLDELLDRHPDALFVLPQAEASQRPDLSPLGVSRGFNIARFRPARLVVLERAP